MAKNLLGGVKVTGLGKYGAPVHRLKRTYEGRLYDGAQPWHPSKPRVRVRQAQLVSKAFLTGLHGLSGHPDLPNFLSFSRKPYCVLCNPEWNGGGAV